MTEFEDQGVSLTALAVAAGRAVETSRPDPLIKDPFAALLVKEAHSHVDFPTAWPSELSAVSSLQHPLLLASIYIGVRTRFIDDFLLSGPKVQTVILGAGLDTRSHRLTWPPGSRVYEIDHASVLAFKAGVLEGARAAPASELISIDADLTQPWRALLLASGFDPGQPTTWVLEGVLPYLDSAAQMAVLTEVIALSSQGSRAVIERAVPLPRTEEFEAKIGEYSRQTGLPMDQLLARADPPDPVQVLGAADWQCSEHTVLELCAAYGRTLSLDPEDRLQPERADPGQTRGGFVTAFRISLDVDD
ncbi:SAM-dependent methyltransferase [Paenarthrobacter ureafaciens]|uniref:SAM-dependent methyltransferase n=1 Tax=Paenarthrobacter ureafaciens TaxID=37931 RepID=UPI001FB512AD|nr:SAM-dependent methyltransferase [Paenarthrobacter ureafaciens]UOD81783.1 SAM-dependent methyltransferase [Paenarthrobacter ureafaciens]WNZ05274.1 SAM-dependent methyltransferase [Paenarthrobacter ureafaciens]